MTSTFENQKSKGQRKAAEQLLKAVGFFLQPRVLHNFEGHVASTAEKNRITNQQLALKALRGASIYFLRNQPTIVFQRNGTCLCALNVTKRMLSFLHNLILLVLRGRPWALLQFSLAVARKLCLFMQNNLLCINPDVHEIPSHHRIRKEKCKKKIIAASIYEHSVSSTSKYECFRSDNVCSMFQKFGQTRCLPNRFLRLKKGHSTHIIYLLYKVGKKRFQKPLLVTNG